MRLLRLPGALHPSRRARSSQPSPSNALTPTPNYGTDREPASAIKIFIAYAVYKQIDEGKLTYSSKLSSGVTVEQCLRAMIEPR